MKQFWRVFGVFLTLTLTFVVENVNSYEFKCPSDWLDFESNCYQFIRSPTKTFEESRDACAKFNAHLLSVLSLEEHNFVVKWLRQNDPVHLSWYTSAVDVGNDVWRWNVPMNTLTSNGATSSSSNLNSDPYSGGSRSLGRDFYSILASLWLPITVDQRKNDNFNPNFQQQQQSIAEANWASRNGKHGVYK